MKRKVNLKKMTSWKQILIPASLALILMVGISGTVAYLTANSDEVVNSFESGNVPPTVVEKVSQGVKEEVTIKNGGNVKAYVRAAVIVTWQNSSGDVYGSAPVEVDDYSMTIPADGKWKLGSDDFWYYIVPVDAGAETAPLLTDGKMELDADIPSGYDLSMEIIAQTIQADGVNSNGQKPVLLAWGEEAGGSVTGITGTTLQIQE